MKNKKERDILSINILYDYKDELEDLIESEDFNQLLLDEAINTIKNALNKNRKSTRVFYVPNLECSVVLDKRNFSKVLTTAIDFYENQEDYTKCSELVNLKKLIDESEKGN
jgi:hypothetical protein|tara:strand:- start:384 stop:716 length:333 start_codon:yes stop_codon:yes gene_type:complete